MSIILIRLTETGTLEILISAMTEKEEKAAIQELKRILKPEVFEEAKEKRPAGTGRGAIRDKFFFDNPTIRSIHHEHPGVNSKG
jgi:hypothetical protein